MKQRTTVYIDKQLYKKIKVYCAMTGKTISEFFEECSKEKIK